MRIAFVTPEFVSEPIYDGGLANYLLRLTLSLKKLGHTPVVLVTSNHTERTTFRDIELHRVKAEFSEVSGPFKGFLVKKAFRTYQYIANSYNINSYLLRLHNQQPFDIVQYAHLMGLGLFCSRRIPSVIRLSSYTAACLDANQVTGYRQQQFWEGWAIRRSDALFSPSKLVSSLVKNEFGREVEVIESPYIEDIDESDGSVYEEYLINKEYFLFYGTLSLLKGVDLIANILTRLFEKYEDIYFVFVGKDIGLPDGKLLVSLLTEKAGKYKNRLLYLGKLRHEVLYPIITHSIAVILPSRVDNFPNTCIEAMAHRKIVIGTRGTSFEQLIDDGINGLLCENENEESLFGKIDEVMQMDMQSRDLIGEKAVERVTRLRPDVVVMQLLNFYQMVIDKKRRR